jgi:transcription termination/antitermination protein NusA
MRELHGEKIDVILYSDDLITFAQNALAPAKITRVSPIHHEDGSMSLDCVVEDDQLSLAIGKKGQNVRLASALIGMKIEIKGETEVKGEVAEALSRMLQASRRRQTAVGEIPGIGEKTAERLVEAGIATLGDLLDRSVEDLSQLQGLGEKTAEKILEAARFAEETMSADAGEDAEPDEMEASEEGSAATPEETGVRE